MILALAGCTPLPVLVSDLHGDRWFIGDARDGTVDVAYDLDEFHADECRVRDDETRFCLVSFSSDWLFPTEENRAVVHALNAAAASVSFVEIETDRGHDAFLLDEPEFYAAIDGFVSAAARARGLSR